MKGFFLLCVLSISYATNADYTAFLIEVLRGSNLIGISQARFCNYQPVGSKPTGNSQPYFETMIADLIDVSQNCHNEYAVKTLKAFQSAEDLMSLALINLDEARTSGKINTSDDLGKSGHQVGLFLEPYFRMTDPMTFKFIEDPTAYKDLGTATLPVAIFHGLNQSCQDPTYVSFTAYLAKQLGVYTRCVEIGSGVTSSFLMSMKAQLQEACNKVKADPKFANGLNVVGFSQGGLVARGILQTCDGPKVNVVNTVGTPNNGVAKIPNCFTGFACRVFNDALDLGVYTSACQALGPAGYFKDQYNYNDFLEYSSFLAEFNNEKAINQKYINDYKSLNWLVLIRFTLDTIVDPPESEWFGYFGLNSEKVVPWNQTVQYQNNVLGFKDLDAQGKIIRLSLDAGHLDITQQQYTEMVVPYLL